ncbi:MAG: DUF1326 domain-containing protein [Proteobacteria bacterium]|nr:DUF1326 domain-containing protein [Pseudomonadota bacterium]
MAHVNWSMKGKHLKNCNCAFGCPCDFNARPTYGPCEGMVGMEIDEGHFGDVKLDGLRWAATYHWPGPLHEGNGTIQAIVDERADERQREALLTILSGQEQVEGTFFQIISMIVNTVLTPQFLPIDFEFDLDGRTARVAVPGVFETTSEPIKNPVTGAPHRIRVAIPDGFEYREAEIASATIKSTGAIKFDSAGCHSSLADVTFTQNGVV